MREEIRSTMDRREEIDVSDLEVGDLVLLKNFKSRTLDPHSIGPCIFLEYTNRTK